MASTFLVIVATLIFALYLYIKKKYEYFKDRGVPNPPPYWPLGNFWRVGLSVHFIHRINETYRKFKGHGKLCGFFAFTTPLYIVTDIELIKNILVKDFEYFHDRGE